MIYLPEIITEDGRLDRLLRFEPALLYYYIVMQMNQTTEPAWIERRWLEFHKPVEWRMAITKWDVS